MCDKSCFTANHLIAANTFCQRFCRFCLAVCNASFTSQSRYRTLFQRWFKKVDNKPCRKMASSESQEILCLLRSAGFKEFWTCSGNFLGNPKHHIAIKNLNRRDDYIFLLYPMGSDSSKNNFHKPKFRNRLWFGPQ